MSRDNERLALVGLVLFGLGLLSVISTWGGSNAPPQELSKEIAACETSLPRDQNCIVVVVPDPNYVSAKERN